MQIIQIEGLAGSVLLRGVWWSRWIGGYGDESIESFKVVAASGGGCAGSRFITVMMRVYEWTVILKCGGGFGTALGCGGGL